MFSFQMQWKLTKGGAHCRLARKKLENSKGCANGNGGQRRNNREDSSCVQAKNTG
jgi:hypothetical protein